MREAKRDVVRFVYSIQNGTKFLAVECLSRLSRGIWRYQLLRDPPIVFESLGKLYTLLRGQIRTLRDGLPHLFLGCQLWTQGFELHRVLIKEV